MRQRLRWQGEVGCYTFADKDRDRVIYCALRDPARNPVAARPPARPRKPTANRTAKPTAGGPAGRRRHAPLFPPSQRLRGW